MHEFIGNKYGNKHVDDSIIKSIGYKFSFFLNKNGIKANEQKKKKTKQNVFLVGSLILLFFSFSFSNLNQRCGKPDYVAHGDKRIHLNYLHLNKLNRLMQPFRTIICERLNENVFYSLADYPTPFIIIGELEERKKRRNNLKCQNEFIQNSFHWN